MDNLELVVTGSGSKLRNQHYVAKFDSRESEMSVPSGEVASGKIPVGLDGLCRHLGTENVRGPAIVVFARHYQWIRIADEASYGALGIGSEDRTATLYQFLERIFVRWQPLDIITG